MSYNHRSLSIFFRHQMYLQACIELLEGKLVGESSCGTSEGRARLGALLVQAEAGDHPAPRWLYDKWTQALDLEQNLLQEPHSIIEVNIFIYTGWISFSLYSIPLINYL